jgi:hypothetical protein
MAAALTLAISKRVQATDDPSISICETWLAVDANHEQLIRTWQKLETQLVQKEGWYQLSEQQRNYMPQAAELESIEIQLDALSQKRMELLKEISLESCLSARGVELKLAIALACVPEDENKEGHAVIKSALKDLRALLDTNAG